MKESNKNLLPVITATCAVAVGGLAVHGALGDKPQETCIIKTAKQSETAPELVDM